MTKTCADIHRELFPTYEALLEECCAKEAVETVERLPIRVNRLLSEAQFWARTVRVGECLHWAGKILPNGYGTLSAFGKTDRLAHRVAWRLAYGEEPSMGLMHSCDELWPKGDITYRRCILPAHLSLGTAHQNMADMLAKGRGNPCRGERGGLAVLTDDGVMEMHELRAAGWLHRQLAARYRVSQKQISVILAGKQWPHIHALFLAKRSHADSIGRKDSL